MTAVVTKELEESGGIPASYVVRIFEAVFKLPEEDDQDEALVGYDSNTMNLRAATEFLAMVARKHSLEAEDVHFAMSCYDLELSWRAYNEIR